MKKLYLVDVSSFFFRAYYAIPPLNTSKGLPTNALYGVLNMTVKLLRDIKPDYMAFCFDRKDKSFRSEIYPEYKANRGEMPEDLVPQAPYLRKLAEKIGIPIFDKEGFEADDVIGSLTHFGREQDLEVVIVSGDKDFAQLVGPFISMYDTMREKKYDVDGVIEKWGVKPEQMIDYLAIVGDSSDNIPGVRGIGPKGANKLLSEYKDLEGVYENIDKITAKAMKRNLIENEDNAYLSKELVTICTDIDFNITLNDLKLRQVNKQELSELLTELEFSNFEKALTGKEVAKSSAETSTQKANAKTQKKKNKSKVSGEIEEKILELGELKKLLEPYETLYAISTERGVFYGYKDIAFSVNADDAEVGKVLSPKYLSWKGYDLKTVWAHLQIKDPEPPAWDHMLAAYIVRSGKTEEFRKLCELYLGESLPEFAGAKDYFQYQLSLEQRLLEKLEDLNERKVLEDIELPLVPVLYEMEQNGIKIDSKILEKKSKKLERDIKDLESVIHKEAGESFNVASPKQLGTILFDKMGLPPSKKTKTGYSTNSEVLSKLAQEYPICSKIIEFRELSKLKSTYVDALPQLVKKGSGKLHTHFRQAATATGRLSSVNPNLQNIPIRTERGREIRSAFVAEKGCSLLSVDYSQIELRVLAHITEDPGLVRAFENDLDIHAATAAEIFDCSLDKVSPELRRKAKAVNFGIAYGQGVYGLAEALQISRGEASEIIGNYFGKFKNVKQYMQDIVETAKKQGYVESIFGRRRYIDELKSRNNAIKKFGERAAINAPIQGTASDIVKLAMINVFAEVEAKMLLQVHDELLFECENSEIEEQSEIIKDIMESVVDLKVPLRVNVAWGANWEEAHA